MSHIVEPAGQAMTGSSMMQSGGVTKSRTTAAEQQQVFPTSPQQTIQKK